MTRAGLLTLVTGIVLLTLSQAAWAAKIQMVTSYTSSVSSDASGPLDLRAELNYNSRLTGAPIMVVMHGYSPATGNFDDVRANAQRLRDAGFFVISGALRGREGSDGIRDSGGVEVYDIYDAVEYVKRQYGGYVDPANVSITGYSGGGGNVMSALTKFPDYFRLGASFFGMSDYGTSPTAGWYSNGAAASHQLQLRTDIGDPTTGQAATLNRYAARDSSLASMNNPYSEIHLFVNQNETVCPPVNDTRYRDNAIAAASFAGEFSNINLHVGGMGAYQDFNHNGVNDANELQSWPHGFPTADQQNAAEGWYLSRLVSGSIAQPVLNASDSLRVAGYVKTKPFSLWLGDGQNAAGQLAYSLSTTSKLFSLNIATSDKTVEGILKVDTADMVGQHVVSRLNGVKLTDFAAGGLYTWNQFGNGDELVLSTVFPGDADCDGTVGTGDLAVFGANWASGPGKSWADGDFNGDGLVATGDLALMGAWWNSTVTPPVMPVPEPATIMLLSLSWLVLPRAMRLAAPTKSS